MSTAEEHKKVSRRTVAKGAAWAAPGVVMLGAAPRAAASPQPHNALAGVFTVTNVWCTGIFNRTGSVRIDGRSSSGAVLNVNGTTTAQTITSICIKFGFTYPVASFDREAGDNGRWGLPQQTGQLSYEGHNFYLYESCYNGAMPKCVLGDTQVTAGFFFKANMSSCPGGSVYALAERVVVITQPPNYTQPGQKITWIRNVAKIK